MAHTTRYCFRGDSRLAKDAGLSKSTISQLNRGLKNPLYITVSKIVKCLEVQLGRLLDFDDVISLNGHYPTASVCELCGCPGCLPDSLYEADGSRKKEFEEVLSGLWTGDVDEFKRREVDEDTDPGTD